MAGSSTAPISAAGVARATSEAASGIVESSRLPPVNSQALPSGEFSSRDAVLAKARYKPTESQRGASRPGARMQKCYLLSVVSWVLLLVTVRECGVGSKMEQSCGSGNGVMINLTFGIRRAVALC